MSTWISAHIFHAGDLDALITRVAGPLVSDLNPEGFFFLRYWEGGPHLRLRMRVSDPGAAERELLARARAHLQHERGGMPRHEGRDLLPRKRPGAGRATS